MAGALKLMTREDMLKRLQKGEETIDLSIEKWRAVIVKRHFRVVHRDFPISSATCALCSVHFSVIKGVFIDCGDCPLRTKGQKSGCHNSKTSWMRAANALMKQDYKRFRKYGLLIIARLEKAKKKAGR